MSERSSSAVDLAADEAGDVALTASGAQFELRHGSRRAVVVEVGGGLRELHDGTWAVLDGYPADEVCEGARGQPLLPWPNRIGDGRYTFEGVRHQLPTDEIELGHAIHGLTRWLCWTPVQVAADRVTLALRLYPRPGYPFWLDLRLAYALGPAGLRVETSATNIGPTALPFGAGFHPYFTVGTPLIDVAELRVPADSLVLSDQRQLPTGQLADVGGSPYEFRQWRALGIQQLDACYTGLARDGDGLATVELRGPDGRQVAVWMDAAFGWVMVFTGDTVKPARRRQGLAIEPMTCPANAFQSGAGLQRLMPGQTFRGAWGIRTAHA